MVQRTVGILSSHTGLTSGQQMLRALFCLRTLPVLSDRPGTLLLLSVRRLSLQVFVEMSFKHLVKESITHKENIILYIMGTSTHSLSSSAEISCWFLPAPVIIYGFVSTVGRQSSVLLNVNEINMRSVVKSKLV